MANIGTPPDTQQQAAALAAFIDQQRQTSAQQFGGALLGLLSAHAGGQVASAGGLYVVLAMLDSLSQPKAAPGAVLPDHVVKLAEVAREGAKFIRQKIESPILLATGPLPPGPTLR